MVSDDVGKRAEIIVECGDFVAAFRRGRREVGIAEVHVDPKPQDLTPSDRFLTPSDRFPRE
jgi:hypothetical protein